MKYLLRKNLFLCIVIFFISSCSYTLDRLKNVGKPPEFEKIKVPSLPAEEASSARISDDHRANIKKTNSLWKPGSSNTFFKDNRSWKIGDIVKIAVMIQDNATLNNKTTNNRKSGNKVGFGAILGKERAIRSVISASKDSKGDVFDASSNSDFQGNSGIARKEDIKTEIAAIVMEVLPNGNMIIKGHQEVRVNFELREIKIAGIIRPQDIKADNSINSDQIAEARISYGGRGTNTDVQKMPVADEVMNILSPF